MDDCYDEFLDVVADMVTANCHLNPCGVKYWGVEIGFIVTKVAMFIVESYGPGSHKDTLFPVHMVTLLLTDHDTFMNIVFFQGTVPEWDSMAWNRPKIWLEDLWLHEDLARTLAPDFNLNEMD